MIGQRICVNYVRRILYTGINVLIYEETKRTQRTTKFYRTERQKLFLEKVKSWSFHYESDRDYYKMNYKYVDYENYETFCKAIRFFRENMTEIATIFVAEKYSHIYFAVLHNRNIEQLFKEFDKWFLEREEKFMDKMKMEIAQVKSLAQHKVNGQHGSVASLLKVLTKTMNQQGADIRNVAKMQYLVCVQAGIYIPEEFITDVAVFSEFESEFEKALLTIRQEEQVDEEEKEKKREEYMEEMMPRMEALMETMEKIQKEAALA